MKRRILLIVESLFPLGPASQLVILAKHLAEQGFDIHVATLGDAPQSGYPAPPGCHVHHLQIDKRDWLAWRKIQKLVDMIQPDLCHDWSAEGITSAALAGSVPHVSSLGYLPGDEFSWPVLLKKRWDGASRTRTQWVASHARVAQALTHSNAPNSEVLIIPPGVEEVAIDRDLARQTALDSCNLKPSAVIAGIYAPLVPVTRLKDLIWAIDLMSCVLDDVHLIILGQGSQRDRLKRFLRCTAAPSQVHFVGTPANTLDLIAGLDVYWHSHLQWPLPIGLLTAMRSGVPAVSVLGAETQSVIIHQTTGFGVNLGARDEFARWTKFLVDLKEPGQLLARQGRDHVKKLYPVEPFVQAYRDLYTSLID